MLPLFSSELRVVLCPDKAIILGLKNGLRRKVTHQAILPCTSWTGMNGWRPVLAALEQWLNANKMGRANVTVILSDHFVRYALIPFSAEVTRRAEEQTLARILLEDTYGDPAKQWHLKISGSGYGEPRLVAAVDAELLDAVAKMVAPTSLRLTSIRPYLMSAFNGFYKQLRGKDGLFAVAEPGQVVMVTFKDGQLSAVRRMPLDGEPEEQLPDLLQREAMVGGLDAGAVPVYLHVAGKPDFKLPSDGGMAIHPLRRAGKKTPLVDDARFEMAVVGGCA